MTKYNEKLYLISERESQFDDRAFYAPVNENGLLFDSYSIKAITLKNSNPIEYILNREVDLLKSEDGLITFSPCEDLKYYGGKSTFDDFKYPMIKLRPSNEDDTISGNKILFIGCPIIES